jgi:hypothetical protein
MRTSKSVIPLLVLFLLLPDSEASFDQHLSSKYAAISLSCFGNA